MKDKVELIKAKVEEKINLYERLLNAGKGGGAGLMSKIVALQGVLIDINFIQMDSLPEEPVSEELEEAANFYANTHTEWFDADNNPHVAPAFKAGAQWQKEKDEEERVFTYKHAYEDGYKQAEKDNALTWEDIKKIGDLFQDVARDSRANKDLDASFKKDLDAPFKEILRRFLEQKGGKV